MAASRKLQGEIDRCLKKVSEGVETFEEFWQKVHNATNTNQKEKYEADLKKEIKKLQRLRDQIKSWIASGEIKDKSSLVETRKLIETQMERFKVVERETKTKAYSKEGLGAAAKLDPSAREREELSVFLCGAIEQVQLQLDAFDAELEAAGATRKGKKQERVELVRGWVERHRFHLGKLEALLRMLDNLGVEGGAAELAFLASVRRIKDDVEYYLESHQEPEFEENEFLYDDIEGLEEQQQLAAAAAAVEEQQERLEEEQEQQKLLLQQQQQQQQPQSSVSSPVKESPVVVESPLSSEPSSPQPVMAVINTVNVNTNTTTPPVIVERVEPVVQAHVEEKVIPVPPSPAPAHVVEAPVPVENGVGSLKTMAQEVVEREGLLLQGPTPPQHEASSSAHIPPLLGVAPLGPFPLQSEHTSQLQMLEAAASHMPLGPDSERMRQFLPRNPIQTPSYYPQQPLTSTDSVDFFQRLSIETLFFIFYYLEGSRAQFLAAKVLKKQSWRFHTKYMMWFQRHEEPKVINEEYEQGTYIYFDIEKWGQRKKDGFVFEYRYLEDRDLN